MATSINPEAAAHLDRLDAAVDVFAAAERTMEDNRKIVYGIVREIAGVDGVKQADIVRSTGWTREHIRNIVSGKVGK